MEEKEMDKEIFPEIKKTKTKTKKGFSDLIHYILVGP